MSHITKYINSRLTELSIADRIKIYMEVYPKTTEEDSENLIHQVVLTHSFDQGGYIEDDDAYILMIIPTTPNTLVIKHKNKKTNEY